MNPSIIYWKWNDGHLEGNKFLKGAADIIRRSCFSHLYVTTHWCREGTSSDRVRSAVERLADFVHSKGRKLIFELDARAEKAEFVRRHPDKRMGFLYSKEARLDGDGCGTVAFNIAAGAGGELFLGNRQSGEEFVFCYCYDKSGNAGTSELCEIPARILRTDGNTVEISVDFKSGAGRYFCAALCSYLDFPDFCSSKYRAFFDELFERYAGISLDGAALDEMGFPWHPDFNFNPSSYDVWNSSPIYGKDMKLRYERIYGDCYEKDFFYSLYLAPGDKVRVRAINRYYEFIRNIVCDEEKYFYDKVKTVFGKDAFVGVHPTWFAIEETDSTPEVWKNGITWWDTPRDYGFTDEIMIYPVRLALTHKACADIFYNMWYGEGTGKQETFYKEMWNNVRYGGRTISLGYECASEPWVTSLKEGRWLERISQIEERIRLLDAVQHAPAASDILVVTGIESACSILASMKFGEYWDSFNGSFKDAFVLARDIFIAGYNCDLAGNYEIYNKKIYINKSGFVQYGNQEYKYAVFHNMEFSKLEVKRFIALARKSKTKTSVIGPASRDFNGERLSMRTDFALRPGAGDLIPLFEAAGARTNRLPCGCVLTDGSLIFTCPAPEINVKNRFTSKCRHHGRAIRFEAEDFLYLKLTAEGEAETVVSPKLHFLTIDGKIIAGKEK